MLFHPSKPQTSPTSHWKLKTVQPQWGSLHSKWHVGAGQNVSVCQGVIKINWFIWFLWDVWSYFCLSSLLPSLPRSLMAWPSAQHSSSSTLSSLSFWRLSPRPSPYDSNFPCLCPKRMDSSVSSLSELWLKWSFGSQSAHTSANNVVPQRRQQSAVETQLHNHVVTCEERQTVKWWVNAAISSMLSALWIHSGRMSYFYLN